MVRVRTTKESVINAGLDPDTLAQALQHRFGGAASEVETHDGQPAAPGFKDQGRGIERVGNPGGQGIVARAVTPQGQRFGGGDLAACRTGPEGGVAGGHQRGGQQRQDDAGEEV